MSFLRSAEKVLGFTLNHFALKNLLQNNRTLYREIFKLKTNTSVNHLEQQAWPKISAFIPLLYAKSLGISEQAPTLHWSVQQGLLPKQLLLAKCIELLLEACTLHTIENQVNPGRTPLASHALYEIAFGGLTKLHEPAIYEALCDCVRQYQLAVHQWTALEDRFFHTQGNTRRLTFENYGQCELALNFEHASHVTALLGQWEQRVRRRYAAFVGVACKAMAILSGHRTPQEVQRAQQFGRNFAFAFVANEELNAFLHLPDEEQLHLRLPLIIYMLLQSKQSENVSSLLRILRDRQHCCLTTHKICNEIRESDAISLCKRYVEAYHREAEQNLSPLQESDSKSALSNLIAEMTSLELVMDKMQTNQDQDI